MFEGFEQTTDAQSKKRWMASTGMSIVVVVILGIGGIVLAKTSSAPKAPEREIDVTFHAADEPEEKKPPPPPPPPPPTASKPRPKRVGKVAPVAPTVVPEARPREAEPTGPRAELPDEIEEFGDGEDLGGLTKAREEIKVPVPVPVPVADDRDDDIKDPDPIHEKDTDYVQAKAMSGNAYPAYPEKMRHQGVEAEVKLKVRISAAGEVVKVDVVSGDEPFLSAAIDAVKTWRYQPATDKGTAVASTRLVSVPFLLRVR